MQGFYSDVGERIAMLRVQKGYTRESLATLVGISSKFLYEIENGKKGFSAETLFCLASTLNVTCDFLLDGNKTGLHVQMIEAILQHFSQEDLDEVQKILEAIDRIRTRGHQDAYDAVAMKKISK